MQGPCVQEVFAILQEISVINTVLLESLMNWLFLCLSNILPCSFVLRFLQSCIQSNSEGHYLALKFLSMEVAWSADNAGLHAATDSEALG